MSPLVRALAVSGLVVLVLPAGACGGRSVTSSEICDLARPLMAQVANTDAATYGAHAKEWYEIIDMAKDAEDADLAEFARLVDEKSRNAVNYYIPLHAIEQSACDGEKPDPEDAG